MRTFRVTYRAKIDATTDVEVSTEVIVDDEADPEEAGAEAQRALIGILAGMNSEANG